MHIDSATPQALQQLENDLEKDYQAMRDLGLQLDLTRGKPCAEQLDLSNALDGVLAGDYRDAAGVDVRNYGVLQGIAQAREFFAGVLGTDAANTIVGGNSSLTLMFQVIDVALNIGLNGQPWKSSGPVKFLCPVPGYDRHFAICQHLGIEMINVAMTADGPDMDQVEALLREDASIKGMWCVPRFSNPTGIVYSDDVVERIAGLGKLAGEGFLAMWDNAYAVHALSADAPVLANLHAACAARGTLDSVVQFGSTSKVTFAGAGVAFLASSQDNIKGLLNHLQYSSIGPDKVNQLRHVRFLRDTEGLHEHMSRHADIIRPRFEVVLRHLEDGLNGTGMGEWNSPQGGYFISFNAISGLARTIVELAADIGVKLTPAGATFPYGEDPEDRNIRLSPTFPVLQDVEATMRAFVLCVKLASVRQRLQQM